MNIAVAGDTVYVREGVYREQVDVFRGGGTSADKMVHVLAYQNETPMIRGSDQVTGWVLHSGNIWKKTNWGFNSQQVFVGGGDSPSLQQIGMPKLYTTFEYPKPVGSNVNSMVPGSFYYDASNLTLYVWLADGANPNYRMVEASTRQRLFFMGVPYIHLKGFVFRHSNTSAYAKMGAAVELSSNSIIEMSDIQYTDFAGLSMGYLKNGAQALNCNVSNNGNSGVNAAGSYNFRVLNVTMNNNNLRKFNALWHAGGLKATTKAYGTVEYSEIGFNNGSGIWFDYANSGSAITIRNNYIHDNGPLDAAIFFEVSKNARIYNNVLANNQRRGIYISASDNTQVYNNTIVGTSGYSGIEVGGMPRTGATLTGNIVQNNIISHGTSKYDLFIAPPNGTTISGNLSDYNNYFRPGSAIQLSLGSMYYNVSSFFTATNMDKHSMNIDPMFASLAKPTKAESYAVTSASGTIDRGIYNGSIGYDYENVKRPNGGAFDLGAFENIAVADTGTNDTTPPIISVYSPSPSSVVTKGSAISVMAKAADNVRVKQMTIYIDGILSARSSTDTISYNWSSAAARVGTHSMYISAIDDKNNIAKQMVTFVVK
ncbi:right-handed parallel beta-helix repeat-containing protein [Methylotenera sp.]|uniref:right-handed parallel beta-helix repeat-containing protein n=1 Tax=Methylotenera sp. TaxID=2051956 RepID=UPI002EDB8C55